MLAHYKGMTMPDAASLIGDATHKIAWREATRVLAVAAARHYFCAYIMQVYRY